MKYFIVLAVFFLAACSNPEKKAEIEVLEKEVHALESLIQKSKDSLEAFEKKNSVIKQKLDSLDMSP